MEEQTRIDKYLWAIRAFKTRSEATEACKGGKVKVSGAPVKPSRCVQPGETIQVRKGVVTYTYKVLQPLEKRVGAKLVPEYAQDLTPQAELEKLQLARESFFVTRERGSGRPTKKDRRDIQEFIDRKSF